MQASRRRRLHRPAIVTLIVLAIAAPALAATENKAGTRSSTRAGGHPLLAVTAVHTSYALGGVQSDTITATVTQTVRWDLVKIVQRTVLAGGENAGKDVATRDT